MDLKKSLPEKWYIKVQEMENTPEEIVNWRVNIAMCGTWVSPGYLNNNGYHTPEIDQEYTEITLGQFKQYVLKKPLISKPIKPFPTQWCIKLTKENISIVGVYYNKKHLSEPNCDTYTENEAIGYYVKSHNDRNEYVKNGYTACSFFGKPSDSYPEITLEQFKEFVMNEPVKIETSKTEKDWSNATKEELIEEAKRRYPVGTKFISAMNPEFTYEVISSEFYDWLDRGTDIVVNSSKGPSVYCGGKWAEIVSLPKSKVESTIEYAECIAYLCGLKVGQIYEVRDKRIGDYCYPAIGQFKPSTKEAFEAQDKPKSIEKWGKDSYVVCVNDYGLHFKVGDIGKIENVKYTVDISNSVGKACLPSKDHCKWFATLEEAKNFSKQITPAQIMYPQTPTLEVWLEETKAMNLDLESLVDRINYGTTCPYLEVYCKLEGDYPIEKAHNLLDIWGKDPLHIKPIKVKSLNSTQLLSLGDEELPMVSIIKTKTVSILSIN